MTTQPPDFDKVLAPWRPEIGEDPTQGPWITADDAIQSLEALREWVLDQTDALTQYMWLIENAPRDGAVKFRGRRADAFSLPALPMEGDLYVDSNAAEHGWLWVGNAWADIQLRDRSVLRFRGTFADNAALPTSVPSPADGDFAWTRVDGHLWAYHNGRWEDAGAASAPSTGGTANPPITVNGS